MVTVETLDEAIDFVNAREKPLSLYVFTESRKTFERINKLTSAGGVCHNDALMQAGGEWGGREREREEREREREREFTPLFIHAVPTLPFGGVGNSGFGCYHFKYSFDTFSHYKGVLSTGTGLESLNK